MIRNVFLFLGTFVAGALIALIARAAMFSPHAEPDATPGGAADYAPMVTNHLVPAKAADATSASAAPAMVAGTDAHAAHRSKSAPVNTVCAICGMEVDPRLPTAQYRGKTIGFGCKMCAPKFKADPDRYGPHYLRNEVMP